MFVYLARPIDQLGESSFLGTLEATIHSLLFEANIGTFLPHTAYRANIAEHSNATTIDEINRYAIRTADALIALLPAGVATLGTPVEIEQALQLGKPVVVITDIPYSVQLAAWSTRGAHVYQPLDMGDLPNAVELLGLLTPAAKTHTGHLLVKYGPTASKLTRAHPTDAGLDLATSATWTLPTGHRQLIPTGVFGSVPEGWYGRITGRSSALSKLNIQVHEGIIDAGYTGELLIGATFQGRGHVDLPAGTRLAQYILAPVWDGEVVEVDELPETARGTNGWGSSGGH